MGVEEKEKRPGYHILELTRGKWYAGDTGIRRPEAA